MRRVILACALLALLSPLLARTEISGSAFESANKLYEEGKYSEAATAYARLLQTGETSPALYFNLGNAFFKSGQIGRAIAAFIAQLESEKLVASDSGESITAAADSHDQASYPDVFVAPVLNKYTDMQDLLLLDPIHETDAQGWPVRKKQDVE